MLCASPVAVFAQEADAEIILLAVREQQERGAEQHKHWIFDQQVLVRLLRGGGRLAREEVRSYRVRPNAEGQERDLLSLEGKVAIKGEIYPYTDPEYRTGSIDLDGELAESFADDLGMGGSGKDQLEDSMYPLSRHMMERHHFQLHGLEEYRGRQVYRFTFEPKGKKEAKDRGFWEGEVLVDAKALAPVLMVTHQARGIPFVVRTMLGTNVRQVGFRLEYAEMPDGTWFPSRYSGEFSLRVLFGYSRRIALSSHNTNFVRADAESAIEYHMDTTTEDARTEDAQGESVNSAGGAGPDTSPR